MPLARSPPLPAVARREKQEPESPSPNSSSAMSERATPFRMPPRPSTGVCPLPVHPHRTLQRVMSRCARHPFSDARTYTPACPCDSIADGGWAQVTQRDVCRSALRHRLPFLSRRSPHWRRGIRRSFVAPRRAKTFANHQEAHLVAWI